jgi:hypothetical protein
MKFIFFANILFLLFLTKCFSSNEEEKEIKIYGETNYSSNDTSSLKTSLNAEYKFTLYEPKHKKWGVFVAGKLNPLYDHLGKELKMDVFTVLGIDF